MFFVNLKLAVKFCLVGGRMKLLVLVTLILINNDIWSVQPGYSVARQWRKTERYSILDIVVVSLLQSSACTCGDCELMSKAISTTNR